MAAVSRSISLAIRHFSGPCAKAPALDVPWDKIRLEMAPVEKEYFNPGFQEYATYGSGGIAQKENALRTAGAAGPRLPVGAAAPRGEGAAAPIDPCGRRN